jgi:hypothetical protein
MAKRSYRALILAHYDPNSNPWDPPLRAYFPAPPHRPAVLPTQNTLVPDGAPRHATYGGGRLQRVPLPVYKRKPPRRS